MLPSPPTPDFRNWGVLLRTLVLAEFLRLLHEALLATPWHDLLLRWAQHSILFEPVLLSTVALLAWWSPALQRMPYPRAVAGTVVLSASVACVWQAALYRWMAWPLNSADVLHAVLVSTVVSSAVLFYFNWRHHRLSPALTQARLTALQARIRPHFLFNSLNSVMALLPHAPQKAEAMLQDLCDLFRALLTDARQLVPLQDELQLARAYMAVESMRLGPRLRLHWRCDHAPLNTAVPPLLLQPLLENAVRHGVEPCTQGADVTLEIYTDEHCLLVLVSNPLPADDSTPLTSGHHIALDNLRERLALHFDAEARLHTRVQGGHFTVQLRLPLRPMP